MATSHYGNRWKQRKSKRRQTL